MAKAILYEGTLVLPLKNKIHTSRHRVKSSIYTPCSINQRSIFTDIYIQGTGKYLSPLILRLRNGKKSKRASEVTPGNELGTLGKEGRALANCADTVYSGHANQDDNL